MWSCFRHSELRVWQDLCTKLLVKQGTGVRAQPTRNESTNDVSFEMSVVIARAHVVRSFQILGESLDFVIRLLVQPLIRCIDYVASEEQQVRLDFLCQEIPKYRPRPTVSGAVLAAEMEIADVSDHSFSRSGVEPAGHTYLRSVETPRNL